MTEAGPKVTQVPSTMNDFDDAEPPIARRPAGLTRLPLVPVQETWLTMQTRFPAGSTPLVHLVHRLRGPLAVDALVRAAGALVDRHECLRVRFDLGGEPAALVDPPNGLDVARIDLPDLPEPERTDRARAVLAERLAVRFDFERGPLVASCLVRLAEDDHVWLMTVHHILADGASVAILARELGELYRAFALGVAPELPELPVQYGDYALWHAEHRPVHDEADRRYWTAALAGVPPLDFGPRPHRKGAPVAEGGALVDAGLADQVAALGRANRCSPFMVLLAAFQVLLGRWTGQRDFCVGMPVAGSARNRPEIEPVVGQFNNMVPLRSELAGDPTFTELLVRTRSTVLDALEHQDFAFLRIRDALGLPHEPGRYQLGQAVLIFEEFAEADGLRLPGLRVESFPLTVPAMPYDLMVYAFPHAAGLAVRFFYDTALFSADSVAAMADTYLGLLRTAVAEPTARLSTME
jgi:hypothetical protein